jgi:CHAD domain-containing protein
MSLFKAQFTDLESIRLKDEMRRVASALGDARDLDVFESELHADGAEADEMEALNAAFLRRREAAYDAAVAALSDPAFVRLSFDILAWLHAGAWRDTPAAQRPVVELAAEQLKRRRKKLRKQGPQLHKLTPEARHQVRIQAKKVRYGAEFFKSLAASGNERKRAEAFIAALKPVQDALGQMNDVAAQGKLVRGLCEGASPGAAFAAGAIAARRAREARNLLKDGENAARDFAAQKLFL